MKLPFVWASLTALVMFFEGLALGRPQRGDSLSEVVWMLRDHPSGRFLILPLWCWLTYHFVLKGRGPAIGWQDAVAVTVGLAWACAEMRR